MDNQINQNVLPQIPSEEGRIKSFYLHHKKTCWVCLTLIFILGCLVAAGVIIYSKKVNGPENNLSYQPIVQQPAEENQTATTTDAMADWKTYTNANKIFGVEFKYPSNWQQGKYYNAQNIYLEKNGDHLAEFRIDLIANSDFGDNIDELKKRF